MPHSGKKSLPLTSRETILQHHLHLWISSVCLCLPPGKVSGKQAPHRPDAVLLTAPADHPVGETAGTTAGDEAFQGEQVPAEETA